MCEHRVQKQQGAVLAAHVGCKTHRIAAYVLIAYADVRYGLGKFHRKDKGLVAGKILLQIELSRHLEGGRVFGRVDPFQRHDPEVFDGGVGGYHGVGQVFRIFDLKRCVAAFVFEEFLVGVVYGKCRHFADNIGAFAFGLLLGILFGFFFGLRNGGFGCGFSGSFALIPCAARKSKCEGEDERI